MMTAAAGGKGITYCRAADDDLTLAVAVAVASAAAVLMLVLGTCCVFLQSEEGGPKGRGVGGP